MLKYNLDKDAPLQKKIFDSERPGAMAQWCNSRRQKKREGSVRDAGDVQVSLYIVKYISSSETWLTSSYTRLRLIYTLTRSRHVEMISNCCSRFWMSSSIERKRQNYQIVTVIVISLTNWVLCREKIKKSYQSRFKSPKITRDNIKACQVRHQCLHDFFYTSNYSRNTIN